MKGSGCRRHIGGMRYFLMCLFAAVAVAQQREPGKGVNFYSIEKEVALGRQLAAEFLRTVKPLENASVLAYVEGIGRRLAAEIGGPLFPYSFTLIADDPTVLHDIAAFPGGAMFVPASLIRAAKDEDEFAGMLAHAIAHVASRDGTRLATRGELMDVAMQPIVFMGGAAGYAMKQGAALALPMSFLQMRRRMELDADRLAAAKMAALGYDPAALAQYVEREQASYDANMSERFSGFPQRAQRVAAIQSVIAELPAREYGPHPEFVKIQEAAGK